MQLPTPPAASPPSPESSPSSSPSRLRSSSSQLSLKCSSTAPTTPDTSFTEDERPRIRWTGSIADQPNAEWVEDPDDLIPRIHDTLAQVVPLTCRMEVKVAFLGGGSWNRAYTVELHPQPTEATLPSSPSCPMASSMSTTLSLPSLAGSPTPPFSSTPILSPMELSPPAPAFGPLQAAEPLKAARDQTTSYQLGEHLPTLYTEPIELVLRAALPVDPTNKTESEVATMQWIRQHTSIPVPRVYAWDSSINRLGYEWILMERMQGKEYAEAKDQMDYDARINLAKTLAGWVDELSRIPFIGIGNIHPSSSRVGNSEKTAGTAHQQATLRNDVMLSNCTFDKSTNKRHTTGDGLAHQPSFILGPLVFQPFFGDWRVGYDLDRGPFATIHDFALACAEANRQEVSDERQAQRALIHCLENTISSDNLEERVTNTSAYSKWGRQNAQQKIDEESEAEKRCRHKRMRKNQERIMEIQNSMGADHSTVSFDHTRYDHNYLGKYRKTAAVLGKIVNAVKLATSAPGPTVLFHWDMSARNVLIDTRTGEPTAVLDWEQIMTLPLLVAPHYPRLIEDDYLSEHEMDYSDDGGDGDDGGVDDGDDSGQCQMRWAFDERLRELKSPWLDTLDDSEDEDDEEEEEEEDDDDDEDGEELEEVEERDSNGLLAEEPATISPTDELASGIHDASDGRDCDGRHNLGGENMSTPPTLMLSRYLLRSIFEQLQRVYQYPADVYELWRAVKRELRRHGTKSSS